MNNNIETIDCSRHLNYCFDEPFEHLNSDGIFKLDRSPLHYRPLEPDSDSDYLRNDWGVAAARAFVSLKQRGSKPRSCVVIGTGIGLDALALVECFSPANLILTDLSQTAVEGAKWNVLNNVGDKVKESSIKAVASDLFSNDYFRQKRFDLVFENLPNLPYQEVASADQPLLGSFYKGSLKSTPKPYVSNLLASHYQCLSDVRNRLTPNGGIICNIGTRMSPEIVDRMFEELGFEASTLVFDFKCQNEALVNLQAYAEAEAANNVQLNFYPYQQTLEILEDSGYDKIHGLPPGLHPDVVARLDAIAVSAKTAYQRMKRDPGDRLGHFFRSIYATLKN